LSVSQCSFSALWQPENAITAHSSTGLIMSMILNILVLVLEISIRPPLSHSYYCKKCYF